MAVQNPKFFSAPRSASIPEEFIDSIGRNEVGFGQRYAIAGSPPYFREKEGLLTDKITELLRKEFGQMLLSVYVNAPDIGCWHYDIRVRYGAGQPSEAGVRVPIHRFEEIRGDYGLQMVAEVTADEIIHYIRKDIRDTMFGISEEKVPKNEKVKKEETFRKILI